MHADIITHQLLKTMRLKMRKPLRKPKFGIASHRKMKIPHFIQTRSQMITPSIFYKVPCNHLVLDLSRVESISIQERISIVISMQSGMTHEVFYEVNRSLKIYNDTDWEDKTIDEVFEMLETDWRTNLNGGN